MARKHKQRGWWQALIPIATSLLSQEGQSDTNEANQGINSAQMAFNAAEADKKRAWDERMRSTQYQTAIGDMRTAGINPMLAYQQGGAGMPGGATATAGAMIPQQNEVQAGINGAMAAAQIQNMQAQTKLTQTTEAKTKAEIPMTEANTGQITQKTENLKAELPKITAEIGKLTEEKTVLMKEGWNKTDIGNLLRAQTEVQEIEKRLKENQMTQVEAQTELTKVETTLKHLDIAGARNLSDWETTMSTGAGSANKGAEALFRLLQTIKGVTK